ncbi:hypothetical protein EON67_06570, partial [archaeon]
MASMDEEMMGAEETVISDLSNPAVTDKYRAAAKIVNFTLNAVLTRYATRASARTHLLPVPCAGVLRRGPAWRQRTRGPKTRARRGGGS